MREYAPLTQSVQVTFVGTFGTEPPSAMVVTMDLMFVTMGLTFVNDIVPVCGSRSSSVSVTHRARCRCSCCAGGGSGQRGCILRGAERTLGEARLLKKAGGRDE